MSNEKRPYIVEQRNGTGHQQTIVMAFNKSQAIRHVAEKHITAKPATSTEVVKLMQGGVGIETAGEEQMSMDLIQAAQNPPDGCSGTEGGE